MEDHKISIIVPSYNQGQFLSETIQSIITQDYRNYELIIIDGGSTDNTLEVIKEYESQITYWVSEPDHGQTHALNKGYKIATGTIIGWQNSDDVYEKGAFRRANDAFQTRETDFVYGNYRLINEFSVIVKNYFAIDFDIAIKLYENTIVYNQSMFWRKTFSDEMVISEFGGPFNEKLRFVMDAEFVFRAYLNGARFKRVNQFLGSFRMHADNKTSLLETVFVEEYAQIRRSLFPNYSRNKELLFKYPLKMKRLLFSAAFRLLGDAR
ncbi:MAG: glycosyltransferase [Gammaproteobacteria bacterium]|nr:glycosyltransferase [Gammaproteobacteria bacterium]MBU1406932.1 glycosyltransferase [Gammaproteobacteria bacterium]MBU1533075.1 glycosyltransferase [Gammaproteobacteria bacterium]